MRTVTRTLEKRRPTTRCAAEGCNALTREQKPYCSKHILEMGRPQALAASIEAAEEEVRTVAKCGVRAVDLHGLIVEEILDTLSSGRVMTWRRLLKEHVAFLNRANPKTTDCYLRALKRAGLVEVSFNKRRNEVVTLTKKGQAFVRGEIE